MAVGSQEDEVFDVRAVELDGAVNEVVEAHDPFRDTEADGARQSVALARHDFVSGQRATGAIVAPHGRVARSGSGVPPRSLCGVTLRFQRVGGAIAVIRGALPNEPFGKGPVAIEAL